MSFRGNQFPSLASPAVTVCRFGLGWGLCFNRPAKKEAIGTKKFVRITPDKESGLIRVEFLSSKSDGCYSIAGKGSAYRDVVCLAHISEEQTKWFMLNGKEKKQFILRKKSAFSSEWYIAVR